MLNKNLSEDSNFQSYYTEKSNFLTMFQRELLLKNRQSDLRPEYRRRIEIMLLADMGYSQTKICAVLGCSQEMARYWIAIAKTGHVYAWIDPPIGRPKTIDAHHIARLQELVNHSPRDYGYPFQRWTAKSLSKQLAKEFNIQVSDRHINRLRRELELSPRQQRAQAKTTYSSSTEEVITFGELQSSSVAPDLLWPFSALKTGK